jgi:hypothetical protein
VLIHKKQRGGKFDAIALLEVHLGISEKHSGYRILMLESKKMKVSCDVRFYEDVYPYRIEPSTDLTRLNPIDCPQPNKKDEGINNSNLITTLYIVQKTQNLSEP